MANHFFAINRGQDGSKPSLIVRDTSSTAAADFEFRIADVDGQGAAVTRKDAILALEAFERFFSQSGGAPDGTTFPKL